jgi:hypothetical protein
MVEYRSAATSIRGRIYVYASLGRYSADDEAELMREYKIKDARCEDLPRGVLVGTVELYDSDGGEWYLRTPERAKRLRKPQHKAQPVWFNPF